jgi:hypothetical protein
VVADDPPGQIAANVVQLEYVDDGDDEDDNVVVLDIVKRSSTFSTNKFTPKWMFMFAHPVSGEGDPLANIPDHSDEKADLRNFSSLYTSSSELAANVRFEVISRLPGKKAPPKAHLLPSWFMMMFFKYTSSIEGPIKGVYDLGCTICFLCNRYHRLL